MGTAKKVLGAGAGLAAVAAAAGTYFLYGKDAVRNRERVTGWALKAKGEVLTRMEKLRGGLNEETYRRLVDQAVARCRSAEGVGRKELSRLAAELRGAWSHIAKKAPTPSPARKPRRKKPSTSRRPRRRSS